MEYTLYMDCLHSLSLMYFSTNVHRNRNTTIHYQIWRHKRSIFLIFCAQNLAFSYGFKLPPPHFATHCVAIRKIFIFQVPTSLVSPSLTFGQQNHSHPIYQSSKRPVTTLHFSKFFFFLSNLGSSSSKVFTHLFWSSMLIHSLPNIFIVYFLKMAVILWCTAKLWFIYTGVTV